MEPVEILQPSLLKLVQGSEAEKKSGLACPECGSDNFSTRGKNSSGNQKYNCRDCKRNFTANPRLKLPSGLSCPDCKSSQFTRKGKNEKGVEIYKCNKCERRFQKNSTSRRAFFQSNDPIAEYEKDIWDIRNLGVSKKPARASYTLNFADISPPWLLNTAKQFIRYRLATRSFSTIHGDLMAIVSFSKFLAENNPAIKPSDIDRELIVNYMGWLLSYELKADTRNRKISCLGTLLELCVRFEWAEISTTLLIYKEDYAKKEKREPRYIPQEVVRQLNQHLDELPEPLMRMVLIIQECGMRICELCLLKFDCLTQDSHGDLFLSYYQFKMKKDHTIPISKELVVVVQEQQRYIRSNLGNKFSYLFCARKGGHTEFTPQSKPMESPCFGRVLNQLVEKNNIHTVSGNPWNFQSHQFRHTVGTTMINNGVPLHIVMKFLSHESPEMTLTYAHIFDKTMKEEFAKFKDKMVDFTGKVVSYESVAVELASGSDLNSVDTQWLKKNIRAQALPNGLCALPVNQPECPYGANKCVTGSDGKGCPHFKSDIRYLDKHKDHLKRTNENIEWAQETPESKRSQEVLNLNLPVKQNLERIITALESQPHAQQ